MKDNTFSRRAAILGAAAMPLMQVAKGQSTPMNVVVSSANSFNGGINCCAKAMEIIKGGGDTLDAVIAGVNIVELDPRDSSVGYGGLPNEDGIVELDASCMQDLPGAAARWRITRHQDTFQSRQAGDVARPTT